MAFVAAMWDTSNSKHLNRTFERTEGSSTAVINRNIAKETLTGIPRQQLLHSDSGWAVYTASRLLFLPCRASRCELFRIRASVADP